MPMTETTVKAIVTPATASPEVWPPAAIFLCEEQASEGRSRMAMYWIRVKVERNAAERRMYKPEGGPRAYDM